MSVIESIAITHHRLALTKPFKASWDGRLRSHLDATVVRVRTDDGLEGWASGDQMVGFAGHETLFIGKDPLRLEEHFAVLSNIDFHYGRCWPLDLALWDLTGKVLGEPVWKLLGGRSNCVRAYASSGVAREPSELADQAVRYIDEGFAAMKIRLSRHDPWSSIRALEEVRKRVGSKLELMVDCNQGWRMPWDTDPPWTLKDALAMARPLEAIDIYWMEEPLHWSDREGMKHLRERTELRIAGAEMTRSLAAIDDLIADRALDVFQPDAALVGGITGLRRVAAKVEDAGLIFTPHTWTNGAGLVANLHLTAGATHAPFIEFPYDPPDWPLDVRDFMMKELVRPGKDGFIKLDEKSGLGYEMNEDLLAATRIDL